MSDNSYGVSIALGFVKSCVFLYDAITYPIYFAVQKPYRKLAISSAAKAKQLDPSSPYSPWTRVIQPDTRFVDDCQSVAELFSKACRVYKGKRCFGSRQVLGEEEEKQPDGKVFKKLILSDYEWYSYAEIDRRIDDIGRGFLRSGIRPHDNVLIFAETRLEWMLCAQALFRIGATVATLYATLGDDGIVHGINETEVTHCITNWDLLPKLQRLSLDGRIPHLRCIIYMEGYKPPQIEATFASRVKVIPFSRVEEIGKSTTENGVKGQDPRPDDMAFLMYTSGSTGIPKAVMMTHRNLLSATKAFFSIAHALSQEDVYMGYLPLAHVLELAAELFFISVGMSVGYATPLTLTDKSTGIKKGCYGDATLLRPTIITAVPLILDRIRKAINEQVASRGKFFKALFNFAVNYKKFWSSRGFRTPILNFLICKKIKAMLGGRVRVLACGSAPLSSETHDFIRAVLDLELLQGYGLTETCASASLMDLNDLSVGRVGAPLAGVQLKLVDWVEGGYRVTDKPNPRGEIVVGGDNIASGYYKNEAMTKESYREEDGMRWFYTGDIGEVSADGSFKIIDRKKDLVKLQFGEYVSLGKVEAELKSCPYVDNICVYGDSYQTYLIALVVPNPKALQTLAQSLGRENQSAVELCRDPEIVAAIRKAITDHGLKSKLHKMEIPTKIKLCCEEWLPDSGLVTAALKLRRKNIQDFYQMDINRMYGIENGIQSKST